MIPWILSTLLAALLCLALASFLVEVISWREGLTNLSCLLLFMVLSVWGGYGLDKIDDNATASRKKDAQWPIDAKAAGCTRTSYVATKTQVHAIWTCPDKQAYVQP